MHRKLTLPPSFQNFKIYLLGGFSTAFVQLLDLIHDHDVIRVIPVYIYVMLFNKYVLGPIPENNSLL